MNVFSKNLKTSCCCGMDVWWYNSRMVSRWMESAGIYRFLIGARSNRHLLRGFRRWIATDCDRPFFESTCFYESRNSNIRLLFFKPFLLFFSGSFGGVLVEGRFQKLSCIADSTRCGCVSISVLNFFVFSKSVSLYCIRYFWFPISNHTVLVSSIFFCFIFNGVKIS